MVIAGPSAPVRPPEGNVARIMGHSGVPGCWDSGLATSFRL